MPESLPTVLALPFGTLPKEQTLSLTKHAFDCANATTSSVMQKALLALNEHVQWLNIDDHVPLAYDVLVATLHDLRAQLDTFNLPHVYLSNLHEFLTLAINTPVEDGDVPSKSIRDACITLNLATRCAYLRGQGYTVATYHGYSFFHAASRLRAKQPPAQEAS